MKDSAGKPINSPQEINNIFWNFSEKLYSFEKDPRQEEDIDSFFSKHQPSKPYYRTSQYAQLTSYRKELYPGLNLIPKYKSPGPDGFPAEFHQHLWSSLTPLFIRAITEIKQNSRFPVHMNTSQISLLPKSNKDHTSPSNYQTSRQSM